MKPLNFVLILIFLLQACTDRPGVDRFYTDQGEFDMSRFPIIKPYEAITLIPPISGWGIQQEYGDTSALLSISGVKALNKVDSTIFAYAQNTYLYGAEAKEGWFILIPGKSTLLEFDTKEKYLKYLDSAGITPPKLFNPDKVLKYYFKKDTLDWEEYNRTH